VFCFFAWKDEEEDDEGGGGGGEGEERKGSSGDYNNHLYSDRFQNFLGEVRMLRELNHPNICLLMGTCFIAQGSHSKLLLVYELMEEDLNSCEKRKQQKKKSHLLRKKIL
jgi:hypothetical protein